MAEQSPRIKQILLAIAFLLFAGAMVMGAAAIGTGVRGRSGSQNPNVTLTSQPTVDISITDSGFVPNNVQVKPGTVVTWTNATDGDYTLAAGSDSSSSKWLNTTTVLPGSTYSYVFMIDGQWVYQKAGSPVDTGTVSVAR